MAKDFYTTHEVSRFCDVYPTTVSNWIKQGYLLRRADSGPGLKFLTGCRTLFFWICLCLEMDGFQVCRQLKADEKTKDIPVIAVTVLKDQREIKKMGSCGISDYIFKPFKSQELLEKINKHLIPRKGTPAQYFATRRTPAQFLQAQGAFKRRASKRRVLSTECYTH